MFITSNLDGRKLNLICFNLLLLLLLELVLSPVWAIVFDGVSSLHVWITISSLANKDPNNAKALLFRQVELNWINAPELDGDNDYIGLYLDSQPDDNALPVSVHRLNGQTNGQIITDYYLPQIDFYNESSRLLPQQRGTDRTLYSLGSHETGDVTQVSGDSHRRPGNFDFTGGAQSNSKLSSSSRPSSSFMAGDECIGYCLAYHSRNKILARNCLKINPTWMQDSFQYIGTRSLPTLMIPGTHNSGTYPKQLDKTVLHMINKYQLNQDESIFNQLVYGIRHLDLRVGYSRVKQRPERLWIYHDIFRTEVSVNDVFAQVKRFLDLTSHEIVIMDFHRFTVGFENENPTIQRERHSKLIDLIFKQLGQYLVPSYLGHHAPLNEYISMGKRLIVGYANKANILGSQLDHQSIFALHNNNGLNSKQQQVRDIDAPKQEQDEHLEMAAAAASDLTKYDRDSWVDSGPAPAEQVDRRVGTRIYNKLKTLKLISNSFSKRSIADNKQNLAPTSMKLTNSEDSGAYNNNDSTASINTDNPSSVSRAALFFPPVRHLWPNKDTIEGLAQYMNDTTCRKYFGELRSMMTELTPTVFGVISDKYDGTRRLAELVNRQVTDSIRDRWLHCINIVASDFFLGNDLIRLSIYANKMRHLHQNIDLNSYGLCKTFRRIEHLIDKSKIPIQFSYQLSTSSSSDLDSAEGWSGGGGSLQAGSFKDNDIVRHTSSNGNQIILKPLVSSTSNGQSASRDRRDSFVENVSDGFTNLVSSFKRLLNL